MGARLRSGGVLWPAVLWCATLAAPAFAATDSNTPVHVPGRTMVQQNLTHPAPVYPDEARSKHIEGGVKLHATIGKDGTVRDVSARSGPDALRQAAVDAVRQWTYKPYLIHGKPVDVETLIMVNFRLSGDSAGDVTAWPARSGPLRVSEGVMASYVARRVPPVYPGAAQAQRIEGNVVLDAVIGEDGGIRSLDVVTGPPELKSSALAAVKQWTFRPYLYNGAPTAVHTTITLNYRLNTPRQG